MCLIISRTVRTILPVKIVNYVQKVFTAVPCTVNVNHVHVHRVIVTLHGNVTDCTVAASSVFARPVTRDQSVISANSATLVIRNRKVVRVNRATVTNTAVQVTSAMRRRASVTANPA